MLNFSFALEDGTFGYGDFGNSSFGIESTARFVDNEIKTIQANTVTAFGSNKTNVTLEVVINSNVTAAIFLVQYNSIPSGINITSSSVTPLNKYVDILASFSVNYSIIKVKYSSAEVLAANLQESSLRLYRWNGSEWIKFDGPGDGVDTLNKIVFANTSSFSTWGIFGEPIPSDQFSSGIRGGNAVDRATNQEDGGSDYRWQCSEWLECISEGIQKRVCRNVGASTGTFGKPSEIQKCTYRNNIRESPEEKIVESNLTVPSPSRVESESITHLNHSKPNTLLGNVIYNIKTHRNYSVSLALILAVGFFYFYFKKENEKS